jgi:hypothetical protein
MALYVEHRPAETSRITGIRSDTIRKWAQRAGKTRQCSEVAAANVEAARLTWAQRRADVAKRSGEVAADFLERAAAETSARNGSDWMRAFHAAVEKAQLLDGGVTGRVEVSTPEERERRVAELRKELAARRKAG